MARQQSGQIAPERKPLGAGVRQGFRQCLLDCNRHMEAVLDIVLLSQRIGQGLAIGAERRPNNWAPMVPWGRRGVAGQFVPGACRATSGKTTSLSSTSSSLALGYFM